MKIAIRLVLLLISLAGIIGLIRLSNDNRRLSDQIGQLESELGRMPIDDIQRVYFVEIDKPDIPPEIASHLEGVWQFRCYLPPGYDAMRLFGGGRVAKEGIYQFGGSGAGSGMPEPEATHNLFTLSLQKKDGGIQAFYSFAGVAGSSSGSGGTSSWEPFNPKRFDETVVVQKLVSSEQGPRSFDRETILPILKIFDSTTAEETEVNGQMLTTYAGGLIVLCPKSRQSQFNLLLQGKTPDDFDPSWIATEWGDE